MQRTNLQLLILLLSLSAGLNAQFYEYGQDAGKLRWYQLETPNYQVIFPDGVDSLARAFARRLESYYPYLGRPLDHSHSHMPVVIHNESSFSNGVFVWAPKRLEIFTNPDPNGYNQDWLTQLAIHEGRHAVQIDKLNQGFSRGLYFLGGEQLVGAMAIFLPYWYLEGDAVDAETRLSNSGRGRQPSFEMELKAQMLESDRLFSFSKATMGSYRHHIPNHYQLGYLMVRYGRRTYGDNFWIDFQDYAARKPFLLNPTFFSMRKYGLKSKKQFYNRALMKYKARWMLSDAGRNHTSYIEWSGEKSRHYTSYSYPHLISNSLLFAYKSGKDQIPEFVMVGQNGQEKRLYRPGFLSSGRISFSENHVIWDEYVPDTRWSNRNYSVVRSYNILTGEVSALGRKTRYYAPAISGEGSLIAAIEQTEMQKFSLVVMGLDGAVQRKVPSPGNRFIQHPSWMDGDSAVVLIQSVGEGKSVVRYSLTADAWETLFDAGIEDISDPVVYGNMIFFSATFSGIDNIYCHDLTDHETYQVTSARFGAFQPQISGEGSRLFYSNYTSGGYEIAEMNLEEGLWKPVEAIRSHEEQLDYQPSDDEQRVFAEMSKQDTTTYPVKRYSKFTHLFNIHSWLPLYVDYLNPDLSLDPEQLPVSPGLSLVSQNHLSTAVSQLGYEYRDGYHMFHSGIKLKGRYPVFNLFFDYGGEPRVFLMDEGDSAMALPRGMNFTAQSYVPFRFNTGKFLSMVQPRVDYNYNRDLQYIEEDDLYRPGVHYIHYSLSATIYLRKGERDILPRLGLTSYMGYFHAPFDHRVYGAVSSARITGYLPGLLKHHTLKLSGQFQKQYPLDMSKPAFINLISLPRGRHGIYGERLTSYSADYVFPIVYPDLEISSILYLKRIRGAFWADYMTGTNVVVMDPSPHYENRTYTSVGFDLVTDLNLLRLPFPLSVGGRFIYEPETGRSVFEWIYTIDIN
ncbi:MAG: hypothetical protein ABFS10_13375 [Bacteroidota bacterium]